MNFKVDVVRYLLKNKPVKATIDAQSHGGYTALWWGCRLNSVEVVKVLLEVGANPMVAENQGFTPMDMAKNHGFPGCVRLLEVS